MTCTYTDSETPPPSALSLTKTTIGGVGSFDYTVTPAGGGASKSATATTTKPGVEVAATPERIELPAGQYKIAESLPSASGEPGRSPRSHATARSFPPSARSR